jgi:putative NADPH-quinone reductase
MRVMTILAHPCAGSFNHAIAQRVVETLGSDGHNVIFHDLYDEPFDPVLPCNEIPLDARIAPDLQHYCDELVSSDGLIVIHPNWWGQMPAILKGWVDRVIRNGVAFEFPEDEQRSGMPEGRLGNLKAIVFNTGDTPPEREERTVGDPLQQIWVRSIFGFSGLTDVTRRMFAPVTGSSKHQREQWLATAARLVRDTFPAG